jgi:protein TonB
MVEAQPTPKPPPQVQPEAVETIPKFEAPADVTLPAPEPKAVEKKPEEKPDDQKAETKQATQDTPAPQTTSAPRSEQRTAAVPQAPSPGSASDRAAIATWRDLVLARLQQNKRYPASSEARREQGVATLAFTVDRAGHVLKSSISRSSGIPALDDEVLAMVRRAAPLPAFPPVMQQNAVNLVVPIRFTLR